MVLGMPVSWLLADVFSLVLFFAALIHASRQEDGTSRILEIFGFIISAAIFENVGVNVARSYVYDLRRVMMVGSVPLEILLIEAVIWYAAFRLTEYLGLPSWARPFVTGMFASVQDMTIDPAAVFDRYALSGGAMSGQWNWTYPGYEGGNRDSPSFRRGDPQRGYTGFAYRGRMKPLDFDRDALILLIPLLLHGWDFVYAFAARNSVAYAPVVVIGLPHAAYIAWVWSKGFRTKMREGGSPRLVKEFRTESVVIFRNRDSIYSVRLVRERRQPCQPPFPSPVHAGGGFFILI